MNTMICRTACAVAVWCSPALAVDQHITGHIAWTDTAGVEHPCRATTVEIWEAHSPMDIRQGTVTTDLNGDYSFTYARSTTGSVGTFTHVIASGPQGWVSPDGLPGHAYVAGGGSRPPGDAVLNYTGTMADVHGQALSMVDALYSAKHLADAAFPPAWPGTAVMFPSPGTSHYDSDTGLIHIDTLDYRSWDIVTHEFSHMAGRVMHYDRVTPGGAHAFGVSNLARATPARNKVAAAQVGWSEGMADYYAIACQRHDTAGQHLPVGAAYVGDTLWSSGNPAAISYDLEIGTDGRGETDELAVARVLHDFADPIDPTEPWDHVALGHPLTCAVAEDAAATNLSGYWNRIVSTTPASSLVLYGEILEHNGISPEPVPGFLGLAGHTFDPAATPIAPTLMWLTGNNNENDVFGLKVFNADYSASILDIVMAAAPSADHTSGTYTLTAADWATILGATGSLHFVITGGDQSFLTGEPYPDSGYYSGMYWSSVGDFSVVPAPGGMVVLAGVLGFAARRRR